MESAGTLALPTAAWKREYLPDTSHVHLVLEHFDREQMPLLRYLSFLGVDLETGREIVQESFLKLHEHLLAGGDRSHLRAWLYRVAHNLARNSQTAFSSKKTDHLDDMVLAVDPAAKEASAEEQLLAKEQAARLGAAINQLSTTQRECLALRAQGMKYREIAEVLKVSVSTVGENVQRALERLKVLL